MENMLTPSKEKSLCAKVKPETGRAINSNDFTATVDLESYQQDSKTLNQAEQISPDVVYPSGWRFVLMTIGVMTAVLVVALDNYIICMSYYKLYVFM